MPKAADVLDDPTALERVTREIVARCLDISVWQVHSLCERGILPKPHAHGLWDLPACLDGYLMYRTKTPVPETLIEAERGVGMAYRAMRVCLRRGGASAEEVNKASP